jgi:hypothetical protein
MKLVTFASLSKVERTLNRLFSILPGKLSRRNDLAAEKPKTHPKK